METGAESGLTRKLIDQLHIEVMVLADEARAYFDDHGRGDREALPPIARVGFSCEALRVTTRIMHVLAWLLTQRAVMAGEISSGEATTPARRLGDVPASDPVALGGLPRAAQVLVAASQEIYDRVARLDEELGRTEDAGARALIGRLEQVF